MIRECHIFNAAFAAQTRRQPHFNCLSNAREHRLTQPYRVEQFNAGVDRNREESYVGSVLAVYTLLTLVGYSILAWIAA